MDILQLVVVAAVAALAGIGLSNVPRWLRTKGPAELTVEITRLNKLRNIALDAEKHEIDALTAAYAANLASATTAAAALAAPAKA